MNRSQEFRSDASDAGSDHPGPSATHPGPSPDLDATAPVAPRPTPGKGERGRGRLPLWLDTLVTMAVALLIAVLVKTFLIQPFYIPSASMNPTLLNDDKIVVSKLTPGVFDLERGDVIVFEDPDDWISGDATDDPTLRVRLMMVLSLVGLAPDPSQNHLVKRLIGLPGDHVVCDGAGGSLSVNGTELDEGYINQDSSPCQVAFDVTVPEGKVWVMGDNRHASADSAYRHARGENGFVPTGSITGRAMAIFWPASHWSGLGGGRDAFNEVPEQP